MLSTRSLCPPVRVVALCCAILFSFAATAHGDPKPLSKEEQAKVDKAIEKAVAYLKRTQNDQGGWERPTALPKCYTLGQCILPVYALLEAGVPRDDPVIKKAAKYIRERIPANDVTYELSLGVLFFDRLGDPKDKKLIQSLALRLIAGQHRTGGWSYRCPALTEEDDGTLLKLLGDLSKRLDASEKPTAKMLQDLNVPRKLRLLSVFQDRRRFTWREPHIQAGTARDRIESGPSDNSNTQFAMLALWVAQCHGVPLRPTLDILAERFERTQRADGWWPYAWHRPPTRSMICVGLLGLAIHRGLHRAPKTRPRQQQADDLCVLKALLALYDEVGIPSGQMDKPVPYMDVYFLWSLERVGMLYDLPTLADKDWYRWGAEILVTNQKADGRWQSDGTCWRDGKTLMPNNSPVLTTPFALLFLKRSHPMKDLTPKLPFKPDELNKSIAALRATPARLKPSSSIRERKEQYAPVPPP